MASFRALITFTVCVTSQAIAQSGPPRLDSLWKVWSNTGLPDTTRLQAINEFTGYGFIYTDPDSAIHYSGIMYAFAERKKAVKYMGQALVMKGLAQGNKGDQAGCGESLAKAASLFQSIGDKRDLAVALNNMGNNDIGRGDLAHAIEHLTQSLRIMEEREDSSMVARLLGNIGVIYDMQGDTANALDYYHRRIAIAEAISQKDILGEALANIAMIRQNQKRYAEATSGYERALSLAREIGYVSLEQNCLQSLGSVRVETGDYEQGLALFHQALDLSNKIDDQNGVANAESNIGDAYLRKGDLPEARSWGERALALARKTRQITGQQQSAELLYKVYKASGQHRAALDMHELYVTLKDSVDRDENKQEVMRQKFQYDYDKKEALLTAEQDKKDSIAAEELRRRNLQRNAFIGGFALMVLLAGVFFTQRNRINREKKRSEELLLNILPEEVAEELKAKGAAEAVHIDRVTVLFTDFKGFTEMSEVVTPQQLVRDLNECFSAFDRITERCGIEKIKTIGDAYMAAGGVPTPNTTHAIDVIKAALEMRDFIDEGKSRKVAAGLPYFDIRIGVHTGPVVAGIVGVKKFQYDIWGDTVNTASRMESSGEAGRVNISEATYALVKDAVTPLGAPAFKFTPRGKVQAKGKGELEMFFIEAA